MKTLFFISLLLAFAHQSSFAQNGKVLSEIILDLDQDGLADRVRAVDYGTEADINVLEIHFGNGRPNTVEKAYAMTTAMEYFAEATEAYFGHNDFFPFTREQLAIHDPEMFALLKTLWDEPAASALPVRVFILAGRSFFKQHRWNARTSDSS